VSPVSNRKTLQSARAIENEAKPGAVFRHTKAVRSDCVTAQSMRAWQERPDIDNSREVPMIDTIALLRAEHVNFAKLLDLLNEQLDLFHKGGLPNYELMLDIMFYMTHYPDLFHHPKEDLAFGKIKERNGSVGPAVEELMKQHALLKESGERLVADLDGIVNGSIVPREHVEGPGRTYVVNFRSHIEKEETELFPVAAKLLRTKDWSAIDAAIKPLEDPIFGKSAQKRYAAIRDQIAREAGFENMAVSRPD
jgi:hemerythrin-like domain-containing protein